MNALACALVLLTVLAPTASAVAVDAKGPDILDEAGCDYFSYTLTPPDYRIDEDCPLISLTP